MKQINWVDAQKGTKVFDTKTGKFGILVGFGQSGNYNIHYVDFGNGKRSFKPMLDTIEKRYLYYSPERRCNMQIQRANITKEDIKRTLKVLIDNGIEKDEAGTVLQAIGYTLIDTELEDLIPEEYY